MPGYGENKQLGPGGAAQQINARELLIFVFIEVTWATIVLAIEGVFAYPQSRDFKRYMNEVRRKSMAREAMLFNDMGGQAKTDVLIRGRNLPKGGKEAYTSIQTYVLMRVEDVGPILQHLATQTAV